MKREVAIPKDFTPEYIMEEIKDQLTANPFVVSYDYERTVRPDEVPTITITLELMVGKDSETDNEVIRKNLLEEVQKNLDRLKRI